MKNFLLVFSFVVAASFTAFADSLPSPTGEVILTITGADIKTNSGADADIDMEMLEALPQQTIETSTPWFEGKTVFSGPYLKDVMALVGGTGKTLQVMALDDYQAEIPFADLSDNLPILALRRDGEYMPDDDHGPLFIVYDYDSDARFDSKVFQDRSVWSVRNIEIE
jgi:hypothetical protein